LLFIIQHYFDVSSPLSLNEYIPSTTFKMKFSIAATAALTAVAYAAPAAVYDEDCDETVAPVYKVEAPKYEAVHPAPSYDAGKKDEHKAEAPKYEVHPAPTYGGNKGDDKCPKQECPAGDKEVSQCSHPNQLYRTNKLTTPFRSSNSPSSSPPPSASSPPPSKSST
jgi:hypothetical protein